MDIKRVIKDKGYTIQDVAGMIGVNRVTLTNTISGNPTYRKMKQIADAIGCQVTDFFADEDKKSDFASYIRYKGIHYTADTIDEFLKQVEEIMAIAK